ncbi:hypothetical protein ABMY26_00885 (plasmid) [Azospirillum sp. HJ39]|uniref:helix-turn-helix transcriptional regulator n=1 Tax=Azospirillum sp. HJ39 TaxID=3159496 RepID=UPI003557FAA4
MAARLDAPLVIFDEHDQCRYASDGMRQVYAFCDFDRPQTFESLLRKSWECGVRLDLSTSSDLTSHLAFARERRKRERLEFTRTHPRRLICTHARLTSGWSVQLRVAPERAGLEHYFTGDQPITGVIEAIRRREEAARCSLALDTLSLAVLVVSPDCRLLHANVAAVNLCDRGDGFLVDDTRRLRAVDSALDPFFARTIAMAAGGQLAGGRSLLHVAGSRPGAPHAVSITMGADQPGVAAIVAVSTAQLDDLAVSRLLRNQFGLTQAEAVLAVEIGSGHTNEEASKKLGKSAATGREQLSNIFKKINGPRGQLELSRWVSVLASVAGAARKRGN